MRWNPDVKMIMKEDCKVKGSDVVAYIEKARDNIRQADKLEKYFKEHPEEAEKLSEAADLSVMVNTLINSLSCSQEMQLRAFKKALENTEVKIYGGDT